MDATTKKDRILFIFLLGLVGLALGGSVWAAFAAPACLACEGARSLIGRVSLAPLGVGFYAGLLALGVAFGRTRVFYGALYLAAAVHGVLLGTLLEQGLFCRPCFVVAGAVLLASALAFWLDPENLRRGSLLLPLGAVLAQAGLYAFGSPAVPAIIEHAPALAEARAERSTASGTARLLVFTREGCRYCDEFEVAVLPGLLEEFRGRLEVSREPAPPGLPTPTLVVSGARETVFPGLPPVATLKAAIERAFGKESHVSSMLPQPR